MTIKGEISGQYKWNGYCVGTLEFRTNGLQGGDTGHGGFLTITFKNEASTDLAVSVDGQPEVRPVNSLTLTFRGDAEFIWLCKPSSSWRKNCLQFEGCPLRTTPPLNTPTSEIANLSRATHERGFCEDTITPSDPLPSRVT